MILFGASLVGLFIALLLDRFVIDPEWLWERLPHPVVGFGKIIAAWDAWLRPAHRDTMGSGAGLLSTLVLVAGVAGLVPSLIGGFGGWLLETVAVAVMLAQRSLDQHVTAVAAALGRDVEAGRRTVARIVGRETSTLDEGGVARAAIESLAENFSDGVIAPVFWYLVAGLPGLMIYKAINTADSMIGHRSKRYILFGRPAARTDDALNWLPARLTAALIAAAAESATAWRIARSDARLHRSPNAGWPEAAMAGACGLALGGPRAYREEVVAEPYMNPAGSREADAGDIRLALRFYRIGLSVLLGLVALLALPPLAAPVIVAYLIWRSVDPDRI